LAAIRTSSAMRTSTRRFEGTKTTRSPPSEAEANSAEKR